MIIQDNIIILQLITLDLNMASNKGNHDNNELALQRDHHHQIQQNPTHHHHHHHQNNQISFGMMHSSSSSSPVNPGTFNMYVIKTFLHMYFCSKILIITHLLIQVFSPIYICRSNDAGGAYDLGELDQALFLYLDGQDQSAQEQHRRKSWSHFSLG